MVKAIQLNLQKNIDYVIIVRLRTYVPVAQLDRASDCGSEGWKFKSSQARCYIRKDVRAGRRSTIGSRVCLTAPWVRIPLFPYTCSFYFLHLL